MGVELDHGGVEITSGISMQMDSDVEVSSSIMASPIYSGS